VAWLDEVDRRDRTERTERADGVDRWSGPRAMLWAGIGRSYRTRVVWGGCVTQSGGLGWYAVSRWDTGRGARGRELERCWARGLGRGKRQRASGVRGLRWAGSQGGAVRGSVSFCWVPGVPRVVRGAPWLSLGRVLTWRPSACEIPCETVKFVCLKSLWCVGCGREDSRKSQDGSFC
jgi:hypothetical protein